VMMMIGISSIVVIGGSFVGSWYQWPLEWLLLLMLMIGIPITRCISITTTTAITRRKCVLVAIDSLDVNSR